jgi:hypothetical protein
MLNLTAVAVRKHSLRDPPQPTGYGHKNKNQLKTIAVFGVKLNYNLLLALPYANRKLAKKSPALGRANSRVTTKTRVRTD